jgi:hypothetical protein
MSGKKKTEDKPRQATFTDIYGKTHVLPKISANLGKISVRTLRNYRKDASRLNYMVDASFDIIEACGDQDLIDGFFALTRDAAMPILQAWWDVSEEDAEDVSAPQS